MSSWLSSDVLRTAVSMLAISIWTLMLFAGWSFGGAVHLVLALALAFFPWRWLAQPAESPTEEES